MLSPFYAILTKHDFYYIKSIKFVGAGNETRTRDLNLGKVALYQLSYSRVKTGAIIANF